MDYFSGLCERAVQDVHPGLIVLQENCIQWCVNKNQIDKAISIPGPETDVFSRIAVQGKTHIVLGTLEKSDDGIHNVAALIGPDGKVITDKNNYPKMEVESAIFPRYNAFGVQYHPEMMPAEREGRIFYEQTLIRDFFDLDLKTFINRHGGKKHDDEGRGKTAAAGAN